jgi:hypothetical protein
LFILAEQLCWISPLMMPPAANQDGPYSTATGGLMAGEPAGLELAGAASASELHPVYQRAR